MSKKKEYSIDCNGLVPQTFFVNFQITIEAENKQEARKIAEKMDKEQVTKHITSVNDEIQFDSRNVIDDLEEGHMKDDFEVDLDSIEEQ